MSEPTFRPVDVTVARSAAAICAASVVACAALSIKLRQARADLDQAISDRNACVAVIDSALDEMFVDDEPQLVPAQAQTRVL
jgi:hypothetical protein